MTTAMLFCIPSCTSDDKDKGPVLDHRDSLPTLRTYGVSTLISDSGIVRYKIIAETWDVYDHATPQRWTFINGLFVEKFDADNHVEAYVTADTAYHYPDERVWELRGRVVVKNLKGETFRTSLLYWDMAQHRMHSPAYMEINGIEQQLSGYDFSSDEQMTDYIIHGSSGAFPVSETTPIALPTDSLNATAAATTP